MVKSCFLMEPFSDGSFSSLEALVSVRFVSAFLMKYEVQPVIKVRKTVLFQAESLFQAACQLRRRSLYIFRFAIFARKLLFCVVFQKQPDTPQLRVSSRFYKKAVEIMVALGETASFCLYCPFEFLPNPKFQRARPLKGKSRTSMQILR